MTGPEQLDAGLWRWTAPHPDWQPGAEPGSAADWPQEVGSVLYESPDGAAVFVDALLPPDADALWRWADERARGRRVLALTTLRWHRRSRDALVERYGAATRLPAAGSRPAGIEPLRVRRAGETMVWLPALRTLVPGDRILGAPGGGLRLCPPSWLRYLDPGLTPAELRETLRDLLDGLPIERVLVSHGEPVLANGAAALRAALDAGVRP